jgi:hypothetical protein
MRDEIINTDIQFDRLVDGELSSDERRALLQSLDSRPDGWRRCALAFLEAQFWGGDFRRLVRESNQPTGATATRSIELAGKRFDIRTALSWAAIAASVLIAFSLGTMQRGRIAPGSDIPIANSPMHSHSAPSNQIVEVPAPEQNVANPDVVTLFVRDESGQPRSIRVPLMDASELDRKLGVEFRPGMPSHVRSRLQSDGYQVQSKRRYAPLWLENGQRMVLPVEDTKIVPVSENVY